MDTGPLPIGLMFWRKQAVDRLAFDPRRSRYDRRSAIPRNLPERIREAVRFLD